MESATSTTSSNDASSDIQNDEQEKLEGRTGWKEFSPPGDESKVSKTRRERQTAPKDRWSTDSIPILSDSDAMSPDTDPQFPRGGRFGAMGKITSPTMSDLKNVSTHELPTIYDDEVSDTEKNDETSGNEARDEEYRDEADDSHKAPPIELSHGTRRIKKLEKSTDGSGAQSDNSSSHGGSFFGISAIHGGNNSSFRESTPYQSSSDSSHHSRSNPLGKGKGMESATSTTSSNDASSDIQNDEQEKLEGRTGWKEFSPPGDESKVSKTRRERQTAPKDRWSTDSIPILSDRDAMSPDTDPQFPRSGKFLPKNKSTKK